jgi:hypothetical protein
MSSDPLQHPIHHRGITAPAFVRHRIEERLHTRGRPFRLGFRHHTLPSSLHPRPGAVLPPSGARTGRLGTFGSSSLSRRLDGGGPSRGEFEAARSAEVGEAFLRAGGEGLRGEPQRGRADAPALEPVLY